MDVTFHIEVSVGAHSKIRLPETSLNEQQRCCRHVWELRERAHLHNRALSFTVRSY